MMLVDCTETWVVWSDDGIHGVYDDQNHAESVRNELKEYRKNKYNDISGVFITHRTLNENPRFI